MEDELKEIIRELLKHIDMPDEPVYNTAAYVTYEQGLQNAIDMHKKKKEAVYKAREAIGMFSGSSTTIITMNGTTSTIKAYSG